MKSSKTFNLILTSLFAALMCVLGPLTIPIGPIPISFCNLVIMLSAYILGPIWGTASVVIYIMLGTVGLPVFSGGSAGLAKLVGPTGGYIWGYIFLSLCTGFFVKKFKGKVLFSIIGMLLGMVILYSFGTVWYMAVTSVDMKVALSACVLPFLPGDAIKMTITLIVGVQLQKRLPFLYSSVGSK